VISGQLHADSTDDDRRRLTVRAYRLGRHALREIATIVPPDTMLRSHRQLIARKWTYAKPASSRRGVLAEIRRLVVRMAGENPTWDYTRIQGALKNVGHRVGRSTIARILKAHGMPPVPERPTSWQAFLQAHWGAIAGADFFTTEVWTWRGLVTYYTVFVIDLGQFAADAIECDSDEIQVSPLSAPLGTRSPTSARRVARPLADASYRADDSGSRSGGLSRVRRIYDSTARA
jgi:hypothetical protein